MPEIDIVCEVCFEIIAKADTEALVQPITGAMFRTPDALHGLPDPLEASLTWEFMKCPYCRLRPFKVDYELLTPNGPYTIPEQAKQEGPESTIPVNTVEELDRWMIAERERKGRSQEGKNKRGRR